MERLKRGQKTVYQRRMLSNLRYALRQVVPESEAARLAAMIAAMIDGVWLRAALSSWTEADSEAARGLLTSFVDSRLLGATPEAVPTLTHAANGAAPVADRRSRPRVPRELSVKDPATGEWCWRCCPLPGPQKSKPPWPARAKPSPTGRRSPAPSAVGFCAGSPMHCARAMPSWLRLDTPDGDHIQETLAVDVVSGADCLEYYAGLAPGIAGEHLDLGPAAFGYTRREPIGVVAGIGAWNYPLQIACWKAAPALACGNAMIFKPAELTPLSAVKLEEIMREAGVPAGIFQILNGFGETGQRLARHPQIRKISLTGSVSTGRAVMSDAATTLKNVTLELGGKSPIVIFDDANVEDAVSGALLGNFYSAGEVCSNGTRVFVQRRLMKKFLERLTVRTAAMRIGNPLDPTTQVGSLISEQHLRKVLGYVRGRAEGGVGTVRWRASCAWRIRQRKAEADARSARADSRAWLGPCSVGCMFRFLSFRHSS